MRKATKIRSGHCICNAGYEDCPLGDSHHWHCANCGEVSSMMGHSRRNEDGTWGFSCEKEKEVEEVSDTIRLEVELHESSYPPTILLGYSIGSADLDDGRKLEIVGAGSTLRFTVINKETGKHIKQYDLNLTAIASKVAKR